ncbi:MAG TPA: hypothetical protein DCS97_13340 [Planctomycetes bacterium]|nr:hypothetical protein [Planctomycetota bacterium]
MRTPLAYGCILLSLCLLPACGTRTDAPAPAPAHAWKKPWQSDKSLPAWIADPTEGGTRIAAYGSAEYRSSESRSERRDRAMAAARDELARMLRLRIRNAVRDYLADSGGNVTTFTDSVSQQIAEGSVSGTYQRDEFENEKTSELFVWVVADAKVAGELAKSVVQAAAQSASTDPGAAHLKAKAGSDQGFAELDRLLERQQR